MVGLTHVLAGALAITGADRAPQPVVTYGVAVTANPAHVCTPGRERGYLNVDLIVTNSTREQVRVEEVRALVLNARNELLERRLLWQQAVGLLGEARTIAPAQQATIFSPFTFSSPLTGRVVRYQLLLSGFAQPIETVVRPVPCSWGPRRALPVRGRLLVYDGFDFLSHHRRGTYLDDWSRQMGVRDNFQRYGVDLVVIDAAGRYFTGDGSRTDQWLGWGAPVRAPASGVVAAIHDGQPDNVVIGTVDRWTEPPSRANPMSSYGNYVLIDHGGGEFSLVGHLRNGSVRVRPGQWVRARQPIGAIGNSGASGGVHVHFERRTGSGIGGVETLPPYFADVQVVGRPQRHGRLGVAVESGDVIIGR